MALLDNDEGLAAETCSGINQLHCLAEGQGLAPTLSLRGCRIVPMILKELQRGQMLQRKAPAWWQYFLGTAAGTVRKGEGSL